MGDFEQEISVEGLVDQCGVFGEVAGAGDGAFDFFGESIEDVNGGEVAGMRVKEGLQAQAFGFRAAGFGGFFVRHIEDDQIDGAGVSFLQFGPGPLPPDPPPPREGCVVKL